MADLRPFLQRQTAAVEPFWVEREPGDWLDVRKIQRIQVLSATKIRVWLVSGQRLTVKEPARSKILEVR